MAGTLTLNAPTSTPAGTYDGTITFSDDGDGGGLVTPCNSTCSGANCN